MTNQYIVVLNNKFNHCMNIVQLLCAVMQSSFFLILTIPYKAKKKNAVSSIFQMSKYFIILQNNTIIIKAHLNYRVKIIHVHFSNC